MHEFMNFLSSIELTEDKRQQGKVKHSLSEVVMVVLFGLLANGEFWEEIELMARHYESVLRKYLPLPNGIPSHDTLQRVMGLIDPSITSEMNLIWNDLVASEEGDKLRKLLAIDGKTMRGNASSKQKAAHIVTAYNVGSEICFGQTMVHEKSNEITAVPKLLNLLSIKGMTVSADAMSTQVEIVNKIREKRADYVLAVKENQPALYKDIKYYLDDPEFQSSAENSAAYVKTEEWAHSQWECREYYQTADVSWLNVNHNHRWKDLRSIGMVKKTITRKDGSTQEERRYYISSLPVDVSWFSQVVRGHWKIESMHWELDVVFGEDGNKTLNQTAAQNLNNLRKLSLAILKQLKLEKHYSGRLKRYKMMLDLPLYLDQLFRL